MTEQYTAWIKSGHRHAATCVECHPPHAGIGKWVAKADHGFRHSTASTLHDLGGRQRQGEHGRCHASVSRR
jgi:cytochrome c nitrite reductase small subunit